MSYNVRDWIHAKKRNARLKAPLPPETRASGCGPTLVDVLERHPVWRKRLIEVLSRDPREYRMGRRVDAATAVTMDTSFVCKNGHRRAEYAYRERYSDGYWRWRCRGCVLEKTRKRHQKVYADPVLRAKERERKREMSRKRHQKIYADPVLRQKERDRKRGWRKRKVA